MVFISSVQNETHHVVVNYVKLYLTNKALLMVSEYLR